MGGCPHAVGHPPDFVMIYATRAGALTLPLLTDKRCEHHMTGSFYVMPRQPEGKLVAAIRALLRDRGARPFKIQGGDDSFQEIGIPDLLVCYKGRFVGLEAKMPGGKLSAKQKAVLDEIANAGGTAAVVTTVEQVSRLLGKIDKEVARGAHRASSVHRFDIPGSTTRSRG